MDAKLKEFDRLLSIMDDLREKCPWDKKQSIESLRHLTIEETYELSDAIIKNDYQSLKEELGDIMLHLVFYAKIASETNQFDIKDVLSSVCDKLIQRHPHIYGDVIVADEEEVKQNWEKLKLKEGRKSVLSGVPQSMPALIKSYRIQEKAGKVGFEWDKIDDVRAKLNEEMNELDESISMQNPAKTEEEYGDVLFALVNYARYLKIDPEAALEKCNQKFIKRFQFIEEQAKITKRTLDEMSLDEMNAYWERAKSM